MVKPNQSLVLFKFIFFITLIVTWRSKSLYFFFGGRDVRNLNSKFKIKLLPL